MTIVKCLISVEELVACQGSVSVIEAVRGGVAAFEQAHIAGAVPFDIDDIADPDASLPHCLPTEAVFARKMEALGLGRDDHLVIYDKGGMAVASRVWWMFRVFGHEKVSVLDGGFAVWRGAVESGPVALESSPSFYAATLHPELVRNYAQIKDNVTRQDETLIDVRPPHVFAQDHVPGSANVPWQSLLKDGKLLPEASLQDYFQQAGIDLKAPLVMSCNSGVTACVPVLALAVLGRWDVAVYDGSFQEWCCVR